MTLCVLRRFLGAALASAMLPVLAQAQDVTATPHVSWVPPPPAGFDPVLASPAERATYGVPPAPDPQLAPTGYAAWKRAMSTPRTNVTPVIEQTDIVNGPAKPVGQPRSISNNTVDQNVLNWSGSAITGPGTPPPTLFFSTEEAIIGEFVVPTAHPAFSTCNDFTYESSLWPGLDGWNGSPDVLQAGINAISYDCGHTAGYTAWVEWFPFTEDKVSVPAIQPGDLVFVQVWSTSATNGYAYLMDYSNLQSATYHLTPPSGTKLQGQSVEWIVERPTVNGALSRLTNYIVVPWPEGFAWNYKAAKATYYYMGAAPSVGTLSELTMIDPSGNPISSAVVENSDFLLFEDRGGACGRASPPC